MSEFCLKNIYKADDKYNSLGLFLFLLILPPVWSFFYISIIMINRKVYNSVQIFSFVFIYTLLLTYLTPHYDTIGKFFAFQNLGGDVSIFNNDPLTLLGTFLLNYLPIQSFHYFFLLFFLIIFLNINSFLKGGLYSSFTILIAMTIIYCRNVIDLTYFTLAVSVCLYSVNLTKITISKLFLIILVSYLLHPGLLIVLLPSIPLFYLLKNHYHWFCLIYLTVFLVASYSLFSTTEAIANVGNEMIDQLIHFFNGYVTGDNKWARGDRSNMIGVRIEFFDILIKLIHLFVLSCLVYFRKRIKNWFVLSMYIISGLLLLCVSSLYTINERVTVVHIITGSLILVPILAFYRKSVLRWIYSFAIIFIFIFSLNIYNTPRSDIFKDPYDSYYVSLRVFYVPSFLLLDYNLFGFSDEYLLQNVKYRQ